MKLLLPALLAALLLAPAASAEKAAPAPLDLALAPNIKFHRVHTVPQDLPPGPAVAGEGLILDLRYAAGDARNVGVFGAWVRAHAGEKSPLVILANDETAPFVVGSLEAGRLPAGAVTVGPKSGKFSPDIGVDVTGAADRAAYDALERGAAIDDLVTPRNDKPRHDEASIMRDRNPSAPATARPAAGKPAPEPVDLVLQRGVNLLRALAALRKL